MLKFSMTLFSFSPLLLLFFFLFLSLFSLPPLLSFPVPKVFSAVSLCGFFFFRLFALLFFNVLPTLPKPRKRGIWSFSVINVTMGLLCLHKLG